jgi:membrane-associated phospholipid phosphatase
MYGMVLLALLSDTASVLSQDTPSPEGRPRPAAKEDVILRWNETTLQAIKTAHTPPPQAARQLAMVHAAMYDAVNSIDRSHHSYRFEVTAGPGASAECAAAVAAHRVLVALYPKQVARFDTALDECCADIPDGKGKDTGATVGQKIAEKVLDWRARDGSTRRVVHRGEKKPGVWRPTPPNYKAALLPQWRSLTCFCMDKSEQFRPDAPPALTSTAYAESLEEVRLLGSARSRTRTPDQTEIARFWADGDGTVTPPGHWNRIARTAALAQGNSMVNNARLFALLNLALADAAIVAWDCKFHYNFWRPIDAIREANVDPDPDWTPLLETPPFPTYTSGHSTFSGAGAAVLACFFGRDDVRFTDTSEGLPGVKRSYRGFWAAAEEAGRSRIYGGIHFEFDNVAGLASGREVGKWVCRTFLGPRG